MFNLVSKRIVALLVVLGGIVLVLFATSAINSSGNGKTSSFIKAVEANDATKSYTFFSKTQQSTLNQATWKTNLSQIKTAIGDNKFEKQKTIDTTKLYEYYNVKSGSKRYALNLILVDEDGKLKIDNLHFTEIVPVTNTYQQAQKSE